MSKVRPCYTVIQLSKQEARRLTSVSTGLLYVVRTYVLILASEIGEEELTKQYGSMRDAHALVS